MRGTSVIEGLSEAELTAEVRTEQTGLVNEFGSVDGELVELRTQHAAALIAEGNEEAEKRGEFTESIDGESAETRALLRKVSVSDYLAPAAGGAGLSGAAAELNAALEVPLPGKGGGVAIPWAVLAGPEIRQGEDGQREKRAFTDSGDYGGGIVQRPILQRLFAPGIMDLLGVRMDTVPAAPVSIKPTTARYAAYQPRRAP